MSQPDERPTSAPAAGYLLVVGRIADFTRMGAYSKALPAVYAAHGGRHLALGGAGRGIDWLAGPHRDRSLVLARFGSREAVERFWWSAEYRAAARLREGAGAFTVLAVAGTSPPAHAAAAVYLVVCTLALDAAAYDAWRSAFVAECAAHAGSVLVDAAESDLRPLEGDPVWDRVCVVQWPSAAALDALLASARGAELLRRLAGAGVAFVARAAALPAH